MKRITRIATVLSAACLALATVAGMVGCSTPPSPSELTDETLKTVSGITVDGLIELANSDEAKEAGVDASALAQYFGDESTLTSEQQDAMKTLINKLYDFEYTIGDETIDGDTATVMVTFKTYDLGPTLKEVVTDAISDATAAAAAGENIDSTKLANQLFTDMAKAADGISEKTLTTEVPITFTKSNDEWTMDSLAQNEKFQQAFLGSLKDVFSSISG